MKRMLAVLAPIGLLAACGSPSTPSSASYSPASPAASPIIVSPAGGSDVEVSPAPSPVAGTSDAVLVDLKSDPQSYKISLVDSDGGVARQMVALKRTPLSTHDGQAVQLPYVSTTLASLYYLDGDSKIVGIRMNSAPPTVAPLDVPSGSEAAFAVSPDDSTIAVSVLDFSKSPVHVTLYTDALAGGRKNVIYQSDSNYVWPVAWHAGLIVLAHAYGPHEEDIAKAAPARDNPYSAISYHLVDPANANRKVLMGACTVSGVLSPAGSGCIQGGSIDWQGNTADWSTNDWGSRSSAASLSPDGQWMAASNPNDPSQMGIWRRQDGLMAGWAYGPGLHDWAGWIDTRTIIVGSEGADWQPQVENVITGGVVHLVAARGFVAAVYPTNLV